MATGFRFAGFELDPDNRRLSRDGVPVELNARYLDALVLLATERGRLVSKDRFLAQVWRGIPVTDEALTQCIKTLRRQLGDDAGNPRFIETVPKHGYRFLPEVEMLGDGSAAAAPPGRAAAPLTAWQRFLVLGGAGTLGGGVAGATGGLFYGFAGASDSLQPGVGALSVVLVVAALSTAVGMIGAAGVGLGVAAAVFAVRPAWYWSVVGGALGGLITGAVVRLLGLDAFHLLFGTAPADITGAREGLVLGAAVGLTAWMARGSTGPRALRIGAGIAALAGGVAGALVTLLGGRLMAGSLDLLVRSFPDSRLRLDPIGDLIGESGFGPASQVVTGALEGALFGGCVVGAMIVARRAIAAR